jgi:hypothetical protein
MNKQKQRIALEQPSAYIVQVQGVINETWLDYFDEMSMTVEGEDGWATTTITGTIRDQSALQGLLQNLYNLGLVLLKVERINK